MRIIITLLLLIVINIPVYAAVKDNVYDPNRPEWNEFCPMEYQNAERNTRKLITYYQRINVWENNYWVDRREQFNAEVAKCDAIQQKDIKDRCYTKLRDVQHYQNDMFLQTKNQKIQQRNLNDAFGYAILLKSTPQEVNVNGNVEHNINGNMNIRNYHY